MRWTIKMVTRKVGFNQRNETAKRREDKAKPIHRIERVAMQSSHLHLTFRGYLRKSIRMRRSKRPSETIGKRIGSKRQACGMMKMSKSIKKGEQASITIEEKARKRKKN